MRHQTIYVRNLSEFCSVSQEMEKRAKWLGYDEISYRKKVAIKEMWETDDGVRVYIVLRIPRRKKKRSLDLDLTSLLH